MVDAPGIGAECLMTLFNVKPHEGVETSARAYLGAILVLEAMLAIRAIAKGLASVK